MYPGDDYGDDWAEIDECWEPLEHRGPAWRPGFDQPDGDRAILDGRIRDVDTATLRGEYL